MNSYERQKLENTEELIRNMTGGLVDFSEANRDLQKTQKELNAVWDEILKQKESGNSA